MASTSKTAAFIGILGIAAVTGAFFVGRIGPTDRAERAEGTLARALDEIYHHELGVVLRAPSLVRKVRLIDELSALQTARAIAFDPSVVAAFAGGPVDRKALEESIDRDVPDRAHSIYIVDATGAVAASREVPVAGGGVRPQLAGADGKVTVAAVAAGLRERVELSEVVIVPPERAVQLTVVSIIEPEAVEPRGVVIVVEDLVEYVTVDMEEVGGYLVYFDDATVIDSGPAELAAALGTDALKDARAQAAQHGYSGTPVEVAAGSRKFLAAVIKLPRTSGRPLPPGYPPEATYVLFAIDAFDPTQP